MTYQFGTKYKYIKPNTFQQSSEQIQQQQTNETTVIPEKTTISQHFSYAVYDEATGKMMEMRELRNHPKQQQERNGTDQLQMNMDNWWK